MPLSSRIDLIVIKIISPLKKYILSYYNVLMKIFKSLAKNA